MLLRVRSRRRLLKKEKRQKDKNDRDDAKNRHNQPAQEQVFLTKMNKYIFQIDKLTSEGKEEYV